MLISKLLGLVGLAASSLLILGVVVFTQTPGKAGDRSHHEKIEAGR